MAEDIEIPPFHVQPLLSELYHSRDLLDLSAPEAGPSTPTQLASSPAPSSIFASATSIAAAAGRRAAAAASGASPLGSPTPQSQNRSTFSPDRAGREALPGASDTGRKEIRCVEGYGQNLYVGGSDGVVEWWVCDGGQVSSKGEGWSLRHKHTLFPRRPVSKIVLIPKISKALILSDGTMHVFSLPGLEPVPSAYISPLRGIISVILDDEEMEWAGPGSEDRTAEVTVVLVRRRGLGIYKVGSRMQAVKEIPLPSGPTAHALIRTYLCAAIPSSNTYSLIDLSDASLTEVLPVSQVDTALLDYDPRPNVVVIPGEDEFLVTSYTGAGTMGVFLNGQGDPVRGTMEWDHHPLAITIESGYIVALLRNNRICVHSLNDLEKPVQTIDLDPSLQPFGLSYSPYGISVRDVARDERMVTTHFRLLGGKLAPLAPIAPMSFSPEREMKVPTVNNDVPQESPLQSIDIFSPPDASSPPTEEPPSGSGLTPPSSPPSFRRQPIAPKRQSSLLQSTAPTIKGPFSTCVAETLVVGPNGIMSLAPLPPVLRLEALCRRGQTDDAIALVDEERRKGRRGEVDSDKATHQATVRLLHLYLGCHLLQVAMFERAGDYLLRGKIDARLVVRLFPSLRGKVIGSEEEVDILEGLRGILQDMTDVDEIISGVASQGPTGAEPLDRSEDKSDKTNGLRGPLLESAKAMLSEFLRRTRHSRRKGGGSRGVDSRKLDMVIDTTLAKLLAETGNIPELLALLAAPNDCVLSEIEPFLLQRPYVLSTVMRRQGRHVRVLELLQQVAEAETPDPLCPDPIDEFAHELESVKDAEVIRKYALWLVARNVDKGLGVLYAQNARTGVRLDDGELVNDLRQINHDAANQYLEFVVLSKKSPNRAFHEDLLRRLLDDAAEQIDDEGIKYHLEELDAEYRRSTEPEPFCTFIADVAPNTPIKNIRLKLMLFLQGSPFYDLNTIAQCLDEMPVLRYERAIVLGRLGKNRQALRILAADIGDSVSAQTYCTQGGEIIPPRVARKVAQQVPELAAWAAMGEVGRKRRGTVDAKTQEGLVMELLGVYMQGGAKTSRETASLLNAQSLHLDSLQIMSMLPDDWPLDVVSSFIQRSVRRELHERHTWQILKAISAGENMATSEEYLAAIRKIPPVIVQPTPPPSGHADAGADSVPISEKDSLGTGTGTGTEPFSRPDEGSIAEKEYSTTGPGGEVGVGLEKDRGFFSPEIVDKELRSLSVGADGRRESSPEGM